MNVSLSVTLEHRRAKAFLEKERVGPDVLVHANGAYLGSGTAMQIAVGLPAVTHLWEPRDLATSQTHAPCPTVLVPLTPACAPSRVHPSDCLVISVYNNSTCEMCPGQTATESKMVVVRGAGATSVFTGFRV